MIQHLVETMADEKDGLPRLSVPMKCVEQDRGLLLGKGRRRLVENEEPLAGALLVLERPRDRDHSLGGRPDRTQFFARARVDLKPLENLLGVLALSSPPDPSKFGALESASDREILSHRQVG